MLYCQQETEEREEYTGPRLSKRAAGGESAAEYEPVEWSREGELNQARPVVGETGKARRYHVPALVGVR